MVTVKQRQEQRTSSALGQSLSRRCCQMLAWLAPDNGDDSLYIFIYGFIRVIYI